MTTIEDIYQGAERFISQLLRKESDAQGHFLTGALNNSLAHRTVRQGKAQVMEGVAISYAEFVNDGAPAEKASFKQYPYLLQYFKLRGLPAEDIPRAAAATIRKWMKEGMPTEASKRFSSTGSRKNFVESAIVGNNNKIDEYMENSFDFLIDERYHQTKNETI